MLVPAAGRCMHEDGTAAGCVFACMSWPLLGCLFRWHEHGVAAAVAPACHGHCWAAFAVAHWLWMSPTWAVHVHAAPACVDMGASSELCWGSCSSGVREGMPGAQVASEQAPRGNFVERKNNEFVTIAYVPLKSEV